MCQAFWFNRHSQDHSHTKGFKVKNFMLHVLGLTTFAVTLFASSALFCSEYFDIAMPVMLIGIVISVMIRPVTTPSSRRGRWG